MNRSRIYSKMQLLILYWTLNAFLFMKVVRRETNAEYWCLKRKN